jgi:polar amino acid transport system ATP-binding protein/sulfate transport system ATP-binding protein
VTASARYELKDVLIRIEDVHVSFTNADTGEFVPVLAGVSAEVKDITRSNAVTGQIVGILGPSGVGKTQLARVLTGLQEPTSGQVTVGPSATPVSAGLVGYVPQNYPLFEHRTVLGNLVLAARKNGLVGKDAEAKAMAYLEDFSLADKWSRYPAELSGGQRQRVAIAQQLLCSAHFILLDEPTTGLDPIMKDKVCDLVRHVAGMSEENTVFVVTHDLGSILTIADHLWLLGRVRNDKGESMGARIVKTYDLIEEGLAWQERPADLPAYPRLLREIRAEFETL